MRPALDPAGHRVPRTKPTCLLHTWRPHLQRPFALVLHLHQHESSRNLHLQYLAKNQSTQRCQSLITQGSDHPPVLEPHMVLRMACRRREEGVAGPAPRFLRLRIPAPPSSRGERRRCGVPAQGGRRRWTRAARADPTSRPHAVEPEAPPSSTPRPTAVELPFAVRLAAPPPPAGHHVRVLPSCVGGEGRQRARRSPHCNPCRIRGGEEAGAELQPSPPSRPPHRVPDASTSLLPAPGPPSSLGRPPCTEAPPPPNRAPCAGHPASAPPPEMEGPESWQEPPPICI
jgi:hypothetical protein